jgi:hypothetical protein
MKTKKAEANKLSCHRRKPCLIFQTLKLQRQKIVRMENKQKKIMYVVLGFGKIS